MQASRKRRSKEPTALPTPPAHQLAHLYFSFLSSLFSLFLYGYYGPDLGISVGVLTLPEVVWNRNLGFSRPTATRPSLSIFHGEAGRPGKHPSPHRSTSPLPCVVYPPGFGEYTGFPTPPPDEGETRIRVGCLTWGIDLPPFCGPPLLPPPTPHPPPLGAVGRDCDFRDGRGGVDAVHQQPTTRLSGSYFETGEAPAKTPLPPLFISFSPT